MAKSDFDKFFLNLPPFDRQSDFRQFWKKAIAEVKKIPLDTEIKKTRGGSSAFTVYDVTYRSFMKTQVHGKLFKPKKKKAKIVILVHDYNEPPRFDHGSLDQNTAYFFIELRGHALINKKRTEEELSPGYMIENILDRDTYYMKALYLDVLRSIDMLRLIADLDCSQIGIIGKGTGAAAAVFTAAHSQRVSALALETPAFCNLPQSQNLSTGPAATEINEFIAATKAKRKLIKTNLTYFDSLNFSDMISCPALVTVGFKDTDAPPQCVFSLFNHLLTEKTIEVYPDSGHDGGGTIQEKKSIEWTSQILNR